MDGSPQPEYELDVDRNEVNDVEVGLIKTITGLILSMVSIFMIYYAFSHTAVGLGFIGLLILGISSIILAGFFIGLELIGVAQRIDEFNTEPSNPSDSDVSNSDSFTDEIIEATTGGSAELIVGLSEFGAQFEILAKCGAIKDTLKAAGLPSTVSSGLSSVLAIAALTISSFVAPILRVVSPVVEGLVLLVTSDLYAIKEAHEGLVDAFNAIGTLNPANWGEIIAIVTWMAIAWSTFAVAGIAIIIDAGLAGIALGPGVY